MFVLEQVSNRRSLRAVRLSAYLCEQGKANLHETCLWLPVLAACSLVWLRLSLISRLSLRLSMVLWLSLRL